MQNQEPKKLFAFQLAEKQAQAKPAQQWKVRDGVAVAGCTVLDEEFAPYRESNRNGSDSGDYC